jgi:hypothetical protein
MAAFTSPGKALIMAWIVSKVSLIDFTFRDPLGLSSQRNDLRDHPMHRLGTFNGRKSQKTITRLY